MGTPGASPRSTQSPRDKPHTSIQESPLCREAIPHTALEGLFMTLEVNINY